MRSSLATVLSLVTFPVLSVDFGSIKTMCTSSSATGQCSTPRGTMTNSPSRTTASRSRNFMRNVPFHDEEQLVFVLVMMPDKFAFLLYCFHVAVVYLANHPGVAV